MSAEDSIKFDFTGKSIDDLQQIFKQAKELKQNIAEKSDQEQLKKAYAVIVNEPKYQTLKAFIIGTESENKILIEDTENETYKLKQGKNLTSVITRLIIKAGLEKNKSKPNDKPPVVSAQLYLNPVSPQDQAQVNPVARVQPPLDYESFKEIAKIIFQKAPDDEAKLSYTTNEENTQFTATDDTVTLTYELTNQSSPILSASGPRKEAIATLFKAIAQATRAQNLEEGQKLSWEIENAVLSTEEITRYKTEYCGEMADKIHIIGQANSIKAIPQGFANSSEFDSDEEQNSSDSLTELKELLQDSEQFTAATTKQGSVLSFGSSSTIEEFVQTNHQHLAQALEHFAEFDENEEGYDELVAINPQDGSTDETKVLPPHLSTQLINILLAALKLDDNDKGKAIANAVVNLLSDAQCQDAIKRLLLLVDKQKDSAPPLPSYFNEIVSTLLDRTEPFAEAKAGRFYNDDKFNQLLTQIKHGIGLDTLITDLNNATLDDDRSLNALLTQALVEPFDQREYKLINALLKKPFILNNNNIDALLGDDQFKKSICLADKDPTFANQTGLFMAAQLLSAAVRNHLHYDVVPALLTALLNGGVRESLPTAQLPIYDQALLDTAILAARHANSKTTNIELTCADQQTVTLKPIQLAHLAVALQYFIDLPQQSNPTPTIKASAQDMTSFLRKIVLSPANSAEIAKAIKNGLQRHEELYRNIANTLLLEAAEHGPVDVFTILESYITENNTQEILRRAANNPDTTRVLLQYVSDESLIAFAHELVSQPESKHAAAADTIFFDPTGVCGVIQKELENIDRQRKQGMDRSQIIKELVFLKRDNLPLLQHMTSRLVDGKLSIEIDHTRAIEELTDSMINAADLTLDEKLNLVAQLSSHLRDSDDNKQIIFYFVAAEKAKFDHDYPAGQDIKSKASTAEQITTMLAAVNAVATLTAWCYTTTHKSHDLGLQRAALVINGLSQYAKILESRKLGTAPQRVAHVKALYTQALTFFTNPNSAKEDDLREELNKVGKGELKKLTTLLEPARSSGARRRSSS